MNQKIRLIYNFVYLKYIFSNLNQESRIKKLMNSFFLKIIPNLYIVLNNIHYIINKKLKNQNWKL